MIDTHVELTHHSLLFAVDGRSHYIAHGEVKTPQEASRLAAFLTWFAAAAQSHALDYAMFHDTLIELGIEHLFKEMP